MVHPALYDDLTFRTDAIGVADVDVYARAFEAPGAMSALFEIYRELDNDAAINREVLQREGKLLMPVLATGGGEQSLARNYLPMCEEVAENVTGKLIAGSGHWVAEEQPQAFVDLFLAFEREQRPRS